MRGESLGTRLLPHSTKPGNEATQTQTCPHKHAHLYCTARTHPPLPHSKDMPTSTTQQGHDHFYRKAEWGYMHTHTHTTIPTSTAQQGHTSTAQWASWEWHTNVPTCTARTLQPLTTQKRIPGMRLHTHIRDGMIPIPNIQYHQYWLMQWWYWYVQAVLCASSIDVFLYMCALYCACIKSTFPHTMPSQIASIKHVLNMFLFLNQNLWVVYVCVV